MKRYSDREDSFADKSRKSKRTVSRGKERIIFLRDLVRNSPKKKMIRILQDLFPPQAA